MKFSSCLASLLARGRLLAFMNFVFFVCVFVCAVVSGVLFSPQLYMGRPSFLETFFGGSFFLAVLTIFMFNLILSAFTVVTLPGFVFFPLSTAFLVSRAYMWGFHLSLQPSWVFLAAVPTVILEGEGYAVAAVAGTIVGASWFKPEWVYGEESLTRIEAFKKALKECLAMYFFAAGLLLFAAIIESATLKVIG